MCGYGSHWHWELRTLYALQVQVLHYVCYGSPDLLPRKPRYKTGSHCDGTERIQWGVSARASTELPTYEGPMNRHRLINVVNAKKSPTFFPARGMAELVPPVPPPLPPSPRRCPGRPVGQAGRERLPRASRPAPAPPVSPRWCWGLMARTGCCQMANVGNGQGQGGAGARVPSCRAGKRPIVLRKQGKAVPAMILRAIGLQGSWPLHRVTHTATELHC